MLAIRTRAAVLAGILAVALAVAACGTSSNGGGNSAGAGSGGSHIRTVPESAIARAADVSGSAKGFQFTMSMVERVPGSAAPITLAGAGAFSTPDRSGTFNMTMQAAGQNLQFEEVLLGQRAYMKMPASLTAKLAGKKPWLELNYSELPKGSYLSDLGSLANSSSQSSPAMYLDYLKADSTSLQNLGQATVDGFATTHYHATLNLQKAAANRPASTRAVIENMLKKMPGKISNGADIPVDVWIDGSHLVRKMTMKMQLVPRGTSRTISASIRMNMKSYGPQATPTPPPADETTDLIALLRSEGKLSQLGG